MSISTCALREEGDRLLKAQKEGKLYISIHALREEGDTGAMPQMLHAADFYPRPPRGGRPRRFSVVVHGNDNFYPRPPRGGRRHDIGAVGCIVVNFYPRPPRGGRQIEAKSQKRKIAFLSTPSARRATVTDFDKAPTRLISIHALREEGDWKC